MVSVTGSTLSNLLNDDTLSATDAEYIIDQSIDMLNLYGETEEEIPNMSGSEGSKSLTVQGYERGSILYVARVVYKAYFKGESGAKSIGGLSVSDVDLLSTPEVMKAVATQAKLLAARRTDRDEIEVSVG